MRETIYVDACHRAQSTSLTCDTSSTLSEKTDIPKGLSTAPNDLLPSSLSIDTALPATLDDKPQQPSTLRLFVVHIGQARQLVLNFFDQANNLPSSAALTLFLATTDAVRDL